MNERFDRSNAREPAPTGLLARPECKEHDTGAGHPETAGRFDAVLPQK